MRLSSEGINGNEPEDIWSTDNETDEGTIDVMTNPLCSRDVFQKQLVPSFVSTVPESSVLVEDITDRFKDNVNKTLGTKSEQIGCLNTNGNNSDLEAIIPTISDSTGPLVGLSKLDTNKTIMSNSSKQLCISSNEVNSIGVENSLNNQVLGDDKLIDFSIQNCCEEERVKVQKTIGCDSIKIIQSANSVKKAENTNQNSKHVNVVHICSDSTYNSSCSCDTVFDDLNRVSDNRMLPMPVDTSFTRDRSFSNISLFGSDDDLIREDFSEGMKVNNFQDSTNKLHSNKLDSTVPEVLHENVLNNEMYNNDKQSICNNNVVPPNNKQTEKYDQVQTPLIKDCDFINKQVEISKIETNIWFRDMILPLIEPYLCIFSRFTLRMTCKHIYKYKYKCNFVDLHEFSRWDPKDVFENVLPLSVSILSSSAREKLHICLRDFIFLKDAGIARLMNAVHGSSHFTEGNKRSVQQGNSLITDVVSYNVATGQLSIPENSQPNQTEYVSEDNNCCTNNCSSNEGLNKCNNECASIYEDDQKMKLVSSDSDNNRDVLYKSNKIRQKKNDYMINDKNNFDTMNKIESIIETVKEKKEIIIFQENNSIGPNDIIKESYNNSDQPHSLNGMICNVSESGVNCFETNKESIITCGKLSAVSNDENIDKNLLIGGSEKCFENNDCREYLSKNFEKICERNQVFSRRTYEYKLPDYYISSDVVKGSDGRNCDVDTYYVEGTLCSDAGGSLKNSSNLRIKHTTAGLTADSHPSVVGSNITRTTHICSNILKCNLQVLDISYCSNITDMGLSALLTTRLPYLHTLSLKCDRSNLLTGKPFFTYLSSSRWPKLVSVDVSFTSIWLESIEYLSVFIANNAVANSFIDTNGVFDSYGASVCSAPSMHQANEVLLERKLNQEEPSCDTPESSVTAGRVNIGNSSERFVFPESCESMLCNSDLAGFNSQRLSSGANGATSSVIHRNCYLNILGCSASRCLLEKVGRGDVCKAFGAAVKNGDFAAVKKITKNFQRDFEELSNEPIWVGYPLIDMVHDKGSELLCNVPLTVNYSKSSSSQKGSSQKGGSSISCSCCTTTKTETLTSRRDEACDVWTVPLAIAIQRKDADLFYLLIRRGAATDIWDFSGESIFNMCCESGCADFLKSLINMNSYRYSKCELSKCFETAIRKDDSDIIKILLEKGVLNCQLSAGFRLGRTSTRSPLYAACEANATQAIQTLLDSGCDPNWKSSNKFTPTMLAYQLNSSWLVHFLNAGAGCGTGNLWVLIDVLACAISRNDLDSVILVLNRHPNLINESHPVWDRPILQASKSGMVNILKFIINETESDINTNHKTNGYTALHFAVEEDCVDCLKLLLKSYYPKINGISPDTKEIDPKKILDINIPDVRGRTPIHIACLENRLECAKLLLQASKGHINCESFDHVLNENPLMTCLRMRNSDMSMLFLQGVVEGLNMNATNNKGWTMLTCAVYFAQYTVAETLMNMGAMVYTADNCMREAVTLTRSLLSERLVNAGSDKKTLRKYIRLCKHKVKNF